MNWIDIPACRVLEVTWMEIREQFDILTEDGESCKSPESIYRIIRKSDSHVFKPARIILSEGRNRDVTYLEEL